MTVFNEMAILGGAILPPSQGRVADVTHNLQLSYFVPLVHMHTSRFYGLKGRRIVRDVKAR